LESATDSADGEVPVLTGELIVYGGEILKANLNVKIYIAFIGTMVVMGLLAVCQPVLAHHGSNNYDTERLVTLKGTVTEFVWANPHSQLYFDVTDEKGNVAHWGAEMNQPRALATAGFRKDIMKPGDKITISGAPAKSGSPRMFMREIVLADGTVLKMTRGKDQNGNPEKPYE